MHDIMYYHSRDSLLPLGFDGSIILGVSEQVAVKVGRPVLLKCDVTVTPGDTPVELVLPIYACD